MPARYVKLSRLQSASGDTLDLTSVTITDGVTTHAAAGLVPFTPRPYSEIVIDAGAVFAWTELLITGPSAETFLRDVVVSESDDGQFWHVLNTFGGLIYPGPGVPLVFTQGAGYAADRHRTLLLLEMQVREFPFFLDSGPKNFRCFLTGSVSTVSNQVIYGTVSAFFDGSTDFIDVLGSANSGFDFGSDDFTVQTYIRRDANGTASVDEPLINLWQPTDNQRSWALTLNPAKQIALYLSANGGPGFQVLQGAAEVPIGVWRHIALTRKAGVYRLFQHGEMVGTPYSGIPVLFNAQTEVRLGRFSNSGNGVGYRGWMGPMQIIRGRCLYDAPFTPPTFSFPSGVLSAPTDGRIFGTSTERAVAIPGLLQDVPPSFIGIADTPIALDVINGGAYRVSGTVKREGDPADVPLKRRVQLIDQRSGQIIRDTWSDPVTGAYEFRDIIGGFPHIRYMVVALDYENNYRAVVADNLTPEPQ